MNKLRWEQFPPGLSDAQRKKYQGQWVALDSFCSDKVIAASYDQSQVLVEIVDNKQYILCYIPDEKKIHSNKKIRMFSFGFAKAHPIE